MDVRAVLRGVRLIPRKARLTIDLIRGKNVDEALNILSNTTNKSAPILKKLLEGAIANAENNNNLSKEKLYVKEAYINDGSVLKRVKPCAKGRAGRILKRTSHVTIVVSERN